MTDTLRLDGQVALVTGSGRGLGEAYARLLAARGAAVLVHDAGVDKDGAGGDPGPAAAVARDIRAAGGQAAAATVNLLQDDAAEALVAQTVDRFGRIDILIHNAGVVRWEDPELPSDDIWRTTMAVNADSGFRLIRAALPHMRTAGYGRIVLTVSERAASLESAKPGLVAYAAAKMAVYGLMIGFKANVIEEDIQINAISPAAATRVMVRDAPELTPSSVAPGVAALASPQMTSSGVVLIAAGGQFRLADWREGPPLDLGPDVTPEAVLRSWDQLQRSP